MTSASSVPQAESAAPRTGQSSVLPEGAQQQGVAFVEPGSSQEPVLCQFDPLARRVAVLAPVGSESSGAVGSYASKTDEAARSGASTRSSIDLSLLLMPLDGGDEHEVLKVAQPWVSQGGVATPGLPLLITLHGAQVVWMPGRAALVAPGDRMDGVRAAVIEFAYYEAELRDIERQLAEGWPQLEADSPWAFDFNERGLPRRAELATSFQRTLSLRGRLVRLSPPLHRPLVHPPTLASQLGERLRERTRLVERLELADEQLNVYEHVYEMCGQRASEFVQARKGHLLEWIIIVLLAFQTILLLVERLGAMASTTP